MKKALESEKGIVFWNRELNQRKEKHRLKPEHRKAEVTYDRRFICKECVGTLFSISKR
jgi:hypothetical protein